MKKGRTYEFRTDKDEIFDELVVNTPEDLHVEVMDDSSCWLGLNTKCGKLIHLHFIAGKRNGKIVLNVTGHAEDKNAIGYELKTEEIELEEDI